MSVSFPYKHAQRNSVTLIGLRSLYCLSTAFTLMSPGPNLDVVDFSLMKYVKVFDHITPTSKKLCSLPTIAKRLEIKDIFVMAVRYINGLDLLALCYKFRQRCQLHSSDRLDTRIS